MYKQSGISHQVRTSYIPPLEQATTPVMATDPQECTAALTRVRCKYTLPEYHSGISRCIPVYIYIYITVESPDPMCVVVYAGSSVWI